MDEKTREGNYYSLSNLASQSIIMFFLAIFVSCRADLWSKLQEAQDVFFFFFSRCLFIAKENAAEAKFKDLPSDNLNHLEKRHQRGFLDESFY